MNGIYNRMINLLRMRPECRSSDKLMIVKFYKSIGIDVEGRSFSDVMLDPNAPNIETLRRSRQRVQMEFPELMGTLEVTKHRRKNEADYRKFFTENHNG